ncbi:unnamed protein product, partial [Mesorhabditis spiculigera]
MQGILRLLVLAVMILATCQQRTTSMPCMDRDPNCPLYVGNGFCQSTLYSRSQIQFSCAKSCGMCQNRQTTTRRPMGRK